jgi:hypothetical protein
MSNATPYECKYGTLLKLYAFAHWKGVNIIVYDLYPYIGAREGTYKMCTAIHTSNDTRTIALLYDNQSQHYQALIGRKAYISNPGNNRKMKPTKDDAYWPTIKIEDKTIPPTNLQSNKINTKSVPPKAGNTTQIRSTHNPTFQRANEIDRLVEDLNGMKLPDLETLYDSVSKKLVDRNGYVVDYNHLLTAVLGCNTNTLLLGGTEQSKGASFYLGPYVQKNKTDLTESLDIVLEAT